jgi:hypothetical protein
VCVCVVCICSIIVSIIMLHTFSNRVEAAAHLPEMDSATALFVNIVGWVLVVYIVLVVYK